MGEKIQKAKKWETEGRGRWQKKSPVTGAQRKNSEKSGNKVDRNLRSQKKKKIKEIAQGWPVTAAARKTSRPYRNGLRAGRRQKGERVREPRGKEGRRPI